MKKSLVMVFLTQSRVWSITRLTILGGIFFSSIAISNVHAAAIQWTVGSGGNDHWYEAISVPGTITWTGARDAAIFAGGYLATNTSAAENTFVFNLANNPLYWANTSGNSQGPWLGGVQTNPAAAPANEWTWVTGETWSYTKWDNFEPNDSGGPEEYLHFHRNGGGGVPFDFWNDNDNAPGDIIGYVIEYDSSPVPVPGAVWLFGSGLLGLIGMARRRKA